MIDAKTTDSTALHTISAAGFSATVDAFARDDITGGLWFLSMVGSQTALKAIWASLLKQPPEVAHLIRGADGMALSGGYQRCQIPYDSIGTWTAKIAKLPVSGGHHALYTLGRRSTPSSGSPSCCWPNPMRRSPPSITGSWIGAAPCPSTTPGQTGSGRGASPGGRLYLYRLLESPPTDASPTENGSGRTCPAPWRRGG